MTVVPRVMGATASTDAADAVVSRHHTASSTLSLKVLLLTDAVPPMAYNVNNYLDSYSSSSAQQREEEEHHGDEHHNMHDHSSHHKRRRRRLSEHQHHHDAQGEEDEDDALSSSSHSSHTGTMSHAHTGSTGTMNHGAEDDAEKDMMIQIPSPSPSATMSSSSASSMTTASPSTTTNVLSSSSHSHNMHTGSSMSQAQTTIQILPSPSSTNSSSSPPPSSVTMTTHHQSHQEQDSSSEHHHDHDHDQHAGGGTTLSENPKAEQQQQQEEEEHEDHHNHNHNNGTTPFPQYQGFHPDLLRYLIQIAKDLDNITLSIEIEEVTAAAAAAAAGTTSSLEDWKEEYFDLVANDCDDDCFRYDLIVGGDYYATPDRSFRSLLSPPLITTTGVAILKYIHGGHQKQEVSTLAEAADANETVCMMIRHNDDDDDNDQQPKPTTTTNTSTTNSSSSSSSSWWWWGQGRSQRLWEPTIQKQFPSLQNTIMNCQTPDDCIRMLKDHKCCLLLGDELHLRYLTVKDPDLIVHPVEDHPLIDEEDPTDENHYDHDHYHFDHNKQLLVWPINSQKMDPLHQKLLIRWIYEALISGIVQNLYNEYFEIQTCPKGKAGIHCDKPCSASHGTSDRYGNCICDSARYTGDDCSIQVLEDKNLIEESPLWIVCYVMIGINFFAVGICSIWLYYNRLKAPVKVAQPVFLGLVLLGCVVSTSTIFALAQEDSGSVSMEHNMHMGTHANHRDMDHGHGQTNLPACMAIPWLYSVGFSITFGTLFAKIRRIYMLFRAAATMQRVTVTNQETFLIVGGVLLVDVVILSVWTIADPLQWYREPITMDKHGHPLSSEGYCTSSHWSIFAGIIGAFHFTIMALACYLCYCSRDVPTRFSEGKYLTIAMISNLQIFVVAIPVLVVVGRDSQTSFFIRSTVIWINDLCVIALIFGNLMYTVHCIDAGENDKDGVRESVMVRDAVKKYTHRKQVRESNRSSAMHGSVTSIMSYTPNPNICYHHQQQQPPSSGSDPVPTTMRSFEESAGGDFDASFSVMQLHSSISNPAYHNARFSSMSDSQASGTRHGRGTLFGSVVEQQQVTETPTAAQTDEVLNEEVTLEKQQEEEAADGTQSKKVVLEDEVRLERQEEGATAGGTQSKKGTSRKQDEAVFFDEFIEV